MPTLTLTHSHTVLLEEVMDSKPEPMPGAYFSVNVVPGVPDRVLGVFAREWVLPCRKIPKLWKSCQGAITTLHHQLGTVDLVARFFINRLPQARTTIYKVFDDVSRKCCIIHRLSILWKVFTFAACCQSKIDVNQTQTG